MKEATAREVSDLMVRIGQDLGASIQRVKAAENDEVYKRYRSAVSEILTVMLTEIMNPVYATYPHLTPREFERERGSPGATPPSPSRDCPTRGGIGDPE